MLRLAKWLVLAFLLLVLALAAPVAYIETMCRSDIHAGNYNPLIADAQWQRREANTYLTYPEWHIVYAYDGLAETLKTGDEHQFGYLKSISQFWKSTCTMMRVADQHGGADQQTRVMIHTIGVSFSLEMALKAAYEETIGRLFAYLRGPNKSPQDLVVLETANNYAQFLRQTPWYMYDFGAANSALWAVPVTHVLRGWERRLAIGLEWESKAVYAKAIAAGAAANGPAKLEIRSVISGLTAEQLSAIANVRVVGESAGGIVIETPRYDAFTRILATISQQKGVVREVAGNDEIMVSLTIPRGATYQGPGEVLTRMERQGFASERLLVNLAVSELATAFQAMQVADPGIEHVFDY
ncbi:hypothetical protein JJB09_12690 [Rhizobium sp. KVB221]|uniref:Uncharacterized protein n=2 Tax=Rhizobium setariae TaxID=2801340 RepID=A0A936YLV6_9HYPH|nr:hypothetical protein [Rhizobium setariae]